MEQKTVVAIEISSSKIKGAVGSIGPDGRLSVLAVEETPAINNVRYGRVQNIREVSDTITKMLESLESAPQVAPARISGAAVAIGGRSTTGTQAKAALRFQRECEITETLVQRLAYEATRDYVGDRVIVDTLPRIFYVNNTSVRKAVGNFADTLRGEFTMVTCAKETRQNLERVRYGEIAPDRIHYILRPTAVADLILTPDDKEVGTMLVDFGAETTTVAIYRYGALCTLATIPMGSRLITLDIMAGIGATEETAENIKINLSTKAATPETEQYVRSRSGEIAANILNQLTISGLADNVSKIILTGGGAKLPDFAESLSRQAKIPVEMAKMPADIIFRTAGRNNPDNIDIVAILWAARSLPEDACVTMPKPAEAETPALVTVGDVAAEVVVTQATTSLFVEDDTTQTSNIDIDDDTLLTDDPDDPEEEAQEEPTVRRGFLGFGRKKDKDKQKKKEPEPEPEPEPDDDPDDDDDPDSEPEAEPGIGAISRTLEGIRGSIVRFFTTPEEEDDDEYEDDDK